MAVSMRLTKKLATLATRSGSPPLVPAPPGRDVGLGDLLVGVRANSSVTLTLMPSPMSCWMAGHALAAWPAP